VFLTLIDAAHDNGSAVLCGASNLTPRCFPTLILSEPMNRLLFVPHVGQMFVQPRSAMAFVKAVVCTRSLRIEKYGRARVGGLNSDGRLLPRAYKASSRNESKRERLRRHRGKSDGKSVDFYKEIFIYRFLERVITQCRGACLKYDQLNIHEYDPQYKLKRLWQINSSRNKCKWMQTEPYRYPLLLAPAEF